MRVCVSFSRCCRVPVCSDPQLSWPEQSRAVSLLCLCSPHFSSQFARSSVPPCHCVDLGTHPPTGCSAHRSGEGDAATLSTKNCGSACRCTARTALERGCSSFRIERCSDDPTGPGRCPGRDGATVVAPSGGRCPCLRPDR